MTPKDVRISKLLSEIEAMVIDRASDTLQVILMDGTVVTSPSVAPSFHPASSIVETRYVPRTNLLYMKTSRGDTIEAELPSLHHDKSSDLRPVVYLDQRDWSLLARVATEPESVHKSEDRDAAKSLIALALNQKIILPMSFSHLGETSWWQHDDRRYKLALTLTKLSRGWQMRYPLDVWRHELRQVFSKRFHQKVVPPLEVFTLDGCAAESGGGLIDLSRASTEFPAELEYIRRAMVCMMSYIDTALSTKASTRTPIDEWVTTYQLITLELSRLGSHSQEQEAVKALLLKEIGLQTVAEISVKFGCTGPQMEHWVERHFFTDIRSMKCFGLWADIFQVRHLDSRTKWKPNDLVDMLFLTCAGGYADYVLGERVTIHHLNQSARRLGRDGKFFSKIPDLLEALGNAGIE